MFNTASVFSVVAAVSYTKLVDLIRFGVDLWASLDDFCDECLTDRPQKLTASLEGEKWHLRFYQSRPNVTWRHSRQRLQSRQMRFYQFGAATKSEQELIQKTKLHLASFLS